jgi:predicted phosphodiesterase
MIRGNHDKVACGLESGDLFNPVALKAARWTTEKLTPRNRKFLKTLPLGPTTVGGDFTICHGSPRDEDAYIFTDYDAYLNFRELDASVCFFGHSHIPCVFTLEPHGILVELVKEARVRYRLEKGLRYLINPGSIGPAATATPRPLTPYTAATPRRALLVSSTRSRRRATRSTRRAAAHPGDRLLVEA